MSLGDRSLVDLVSRLVEDLSDLVRKESQLVRAEMSEKVASVGRAGGMLAAGAALLLGAYLSLLAVVVLALAKVMDPIWASLIVAVATAVGGFLLIKAAIRKMAPAELAPNRSAEQLRKDVSMVRREARATSRS